MSLSYFEGRAVRFDLTCHTDSSSIWDRIPSGCQLTTVKIASSINSEVSSKR